MKSARSQPRERTDLTTLVRSAQKGERAAFAELHRRYGGMVHAVLLAKARPDEADDLFQDVFVTAWSRLPELQEPAAFGAWLRTIARNRAADSHRRRRPTVALVRDVAVEAGPRLEAEEALAALRRLPPKLGEPLAMRLVQGMTGPEIAEATGLTPGSVRVTLHRALKRLREELESNHD